MEIYYSNKIKKIIKDEKSINKHCGKLAEVIKLRINKLIVAENLSEISVKPPERLHELTGNYFGCYGIDLNKNYRMIIKPLDVEKPYIKNEIVKFEIIEVMSDYH